MMVPPGAQARLTYLLPIRAATPPDPELTRYLRDVSGWCDLLIVDGSEIGRASCRERVLRLV